MYAKCVVFATDLIADAGWKSGDGTDSLVAIRGIRYPDYHSHDSNRTHNLPGTSISARPTSCHEVLKIEARQSGMWIRHPLTTAGTNPKVPT